MKYIRRHYARKCIIQAIYSWQLSGNNIINSKMFFLFEQNISNIDINYFNDLITGIIIHVSELDKIIIPYISRTISRLDPIEKAILRLAMFESLYRDDIPYKVSINEAIELAKIFGAKESYKFINGVLNKIISVINKK